MTEFVHIKHPDIKTLGGPVAVQAFTKIYQPKGWEIASTEEVQAHEEGILLVQEKAEALTTEEVDKIRTRAELDELALARGIDPTQDEYKTMADLAAGIKSTIEA